MWVGILLVSAWAAAQAGGTVNDLVTTVRTAISNHQSDINVARLLRKYKLSERLDERTI